VRDDNTFVILLLETVKNLVIISCWFSFFFLKASCLTLQLGIGQGKIVGERYAHNKGVRSKFPGASVGKSVTSALIGIRAGDGALKTRDLAMAPNWSEQERQDRGISCEPNSLLRFPSIGP
jgi:hypothetical protein